MNSVKTKKELQFIEKVCNDAVTAVLEDFKKFTVDQPSLSSAKKALLEKEHRLLVKEYKNALVQTIKLAKKKKRNETARITSHNQASKKQLAHLLEHYPPAANGWILNGLVIESQIAGLKKIYGVTGEDGLVVDVLNSASSVNLGAENPWLIKADRFEDYTGIRDNVCTAYHPGIRQIFALHRLANFYPGKGNKENLIVHSESSGTIVDSIAIESVVAFVEKRDGTPKGIRKILAVDGTWAGNYGSAREGTGFHVSDFQISRSGKALWVDRCLPAPTKENSKTFLKILKEKIDSDTAAGFYIEPDAIGDLGILSVDQMTLKKAKELCLAAKLPIIADCVQQLGRAGGQWGENVETILADYPLLVITTAKSSSNGQPFGFVIMPKEIAAAAHPMSQITTNHMNGPLLRAIVVGEIMRNKEFQTWLTEKAKTIESIAQEFGFELGDQGLRGKYLSRAIYVGDNETVKLAQIALLVEDGILVGALPKSVRYQPMLLELSEASEETARRICKKVKMVLAGDVSEVVKKIHKSMQGISSGLAR